TDGTKLSYRELTNQAARDFPTITNRVAKSKAIERYDTIDSTTNDRLDSFLSSNKPLQRVWRRIAEKTGKMALEVKQDEFFYWHPLGPDDVNALSRIVPTLFAAYARKFESNRYNRFLAKEDGADVPYLSDDEFRKAEGPPPWEVMDKVFETVGLPFRMNIPKGGPTDIYDVRFVNKKSGLKLQASQLSSGERILLAFSLYLFHSQDGRQTGQFADLFLFDEVDAPLHPSMNRDLIRLISDVIV